MQVVICEEDLVSLFGLLIHEPQEYLIPYVKKNIWFLSAELEKSIYRLHEKHGRVFFQAIKM